ncbi:MAG: secretin N-terminal domain-containing protein, partial [Acidobacteriota bacterium]
MRRLVQVMVVLVAAATLAGCAASRAFARGDQAARAGDWDAAVAYYRQALLDDPDKAEYKIALERATFAAASMHVDRGRKAEGEGRQEEALREYRRALEYDAGNRTVAAKAAEIERALRAALEAAQPEPEIERLREQARRASPEPILNPASREPLTITFTNASVRDVMNFIGSATGINVTYDRDFQDRTLTVRLDGVTLEQALQQIMVANGLFYKVLNERTILVALDTAQKRAQYEEQVIRTFYISHADATEVAQLLTGVIRVPGMAVQPTIVANKTSNTVTVRATTAVAQIIERIIQSNDKPRAEVVVDVQILEVSRERAKQFGLDLSQYAAGVVFSPETAPGTGTTGPAPFNLNTISTGISTADFYLSVPSAVVRFLESDSNTKVLAKPQLRAAEGQQVTLNLGEEVPIPSTTFTPIATGGAATNPLTSFGYRPIGIIVQMTPRVTYDGEIVLEITLENSARGRDTNIAGQNLPAFTSRKLTTKLRLRDGESNLVAGLLREDERRVLRGFPGIMRLPLLRQLFASNDNTIQQTDIVMLLTPRVIRSHDLTAQDLSPIYIGTQGNMSLGGPPPLIAAPEPAAAPAAAPPPAPGAGPRPGTPQIPQGSSPVPGTTTAGPPAGAAPAPGGVQVFPPPPD